VPVWDEDRGRQNCDESRRQAADRLLIRPASGRQVGTGLSAWTDHWKDTRVWGHSQIESQAKSTGTTLTTVPDGTPTHSQFTNDARSRLGDYSRIGGYAKSDRVSLGARRKSEVIVMFKWIRSRRPRRERDLSPESAEDKQDSGEEEYASQEEDDREVAPSGLTRVKTDDI
jgi:hypothetical protein